MKETTIPQKTEQKAPDTREESRTLIPAVDIFETDEGLAVVADLPGVDKEHVDVGVDKNVLTIKGTSKSTLPGEPLRREYELLNYFRQFQLSDAVDQEKIRAEMKFGVLTVHLPRIQAKQPKKISVSVAS
jgi:HSP20 family molecular chaperone IbpA